MSRTWRHSLALAVVLLLTVAACGDGSAESTTTTTPGTTTTEASTTTPEASTTTTPETSTTEASFPARLDEHATITVTAGLQGLPYLPMVVAAEEGLFEDNNLTVEFVETAGTNAVTAVAAGQADITITLPENIVNAWAQGAPLKIIGATVTENLYRLYVGNDIETLDDLAGKLLGMFNEGNGTHIQLAWLLDEEGAGSAESTFVAVGGLADRLASLQNDQISGTLLFPSFDVQAERAGLRELAAMKDYVDGYPNEVIAVTETTIAERPEVLRAFLDALIRGGDLIKSDPERAIAIAAETSGTEFSVIEEGFEFMKDTFAYDARVDPGGLQWTIDVVVEYASLPKVPTTEDLYDDSLLPEG